MVGRAMHFRPVQVGARSGELRAQLSPEFVVQAPLPQTMLIDQLGALLALTAAEISGGRSASSPIERSLRAPNF